MAYLVELDSGKIAELDFSSLRLLLPGLVDYAPAFGRLALFFSEVLPETSVLESAILALPKKPKGDKSHLVPICFEAGEDFNDVCKILNLEELEFKHQFLNAEFRVEAIGFTPGFPYMTGLPEDLSSLQRQLSPRPRIIPGSVGIAENMCGIYPAPTPGGWNLIGRTPLVISDLNEAFFRFQASDIVHFKEISLSQFNSFDHFEALYP
jgi:inhibitor of KinA